MLRGLLRGYASGYASHVLHHMELTSYLRGFQKSFQPFVYLCVYPCRDVKYLTHAFKMCQGLEVEGLRYETGVIRVWFGYDSGMIRVWFAEHYSAHRIRSRQELQRPVSTRSWLMQTVSAATMKLQWPVSTEAVFNLLGCIGQPDCGDGRRDGAKGA